MRVGQSQIPEFDQEMAVTRKVLERVPADKETWKPHPKSFALGHLAQLVATMRGWITSTLHEDQIDLAASPGYSFQTTESLVHQFDQLVAQARGAYGEVPDARLAQPWSLKKGERELMTMPRGVAVRSHLNHHVHHRAQLAMYLRLLDVPVPSMYGPTADEPW